MMSADAAAADVRARQEAAAQEQLQQQAQAANEAPSEEQTELDEAISSQIPKEVQTSRGMRPYAQFKKEFDEVYEQVRDKDHLLSGRVTYSTELAGLPITIQSLRQRDRRLLAAWAPDARDEHRAFMDGEFQYRSRLMVLSLVRVGDVEFPSLPIKTDPESWEKQDPIQQALSYVEDWDETLFNVIFGLLSDLETAKHFALLENLGNP